MPIISVSEAVATRRSVRAFLDRPVELAVLERIMQKAQMAPSGCNYQPWEATILTGEPLRDLQQAMLRTPFQEPREYVVQPEGIPAEYHRRLGEITGARLAAEGVARDDAEARAAIVHNNFTSYGAPVVLFCYLPRIMGPPQWSDVGMWLQTIMLLLLEEGLDSVPQEFLSHHGRLIKNHLGISDESHIFFCGLGIGYADKSAPSYLYQRTRIPYREAVRFRGFQ
ncbi:MAG: nitroreductase [Novosphingobium sp.]|nr:nitroreductase [Novosphingobium sp.]